MKKECILDFDLLPELNEMDIFIRLDTDLDAKLKEDGIFQEVYERSRSALMFTCGADAKDEAWRNAARLRAGLNEFYSLEDAAKRDFKRNCINEEPAKIRDSKNPLVHLMYLLRHVNVHAQVSNTRVHQTSVISTLGGDSHEVDIGAVILDAPTIDQIQRCNQARDHYNSDDLARATKWIDEVQYVFGIDEVFRRGVSAYCREILLSIGSYPPSPNPSFERDSPEEGCPSI